jgi:UDP-galactopyranose mutase
MLGEFEHIFYTGSIDGFYRCDLGRLRYRTVFWDRLDATGDFQGNAVINYPDEDVPHTRIHEHKHFAPWESHERTVAFREFSRETMAGDDPYYPLRLARDTALFSTYARRAREERNVSFLGRLATYRYLDMHHVIGEALDLAAVWLRARADRVQLPVFPPGVE